MSENHCYRTQVVPPSFCGCRRNAKGFFDRVGGVEAAPVMLAASSFGSAHVISSSRCNLRKSQAGEIAVRL
jgi:hypothetical protein